jgi:predicted nucleic acid-binding protein
MMIIVSNSSPLIGLASIDGLYLLESLYDTVHIPEAVYQEVVIDGAGRAGSKDIAAASWIQRHQVADKLAVSELTTKTKLKEGESEAIILALELKADFVLLDERPARRYATELGLQLVGVVGVLLLAKTQNLITEVKPLLDKLMAAGFRLHTATYKTALQAAGESSIN